jgi:ABC-type polysaccharide transport system permease subunit
MSALAVGYIFQALLKPQGSLNQALGTVFGHDVHHAWLGDPTWTIVVVSFIHAWKWMGLSMLIYLAASKRFPRTGRHNAVPALVRGGPFRRAGAAPRTVASPSPDVATSGATA